MFQEKLRLRLESGEPKCANCKNWQRYFPEAEPKDMMGLCTLTLDTPRELFTTDLTVCSKWEQKD